MRFGLGAPYYCYDLVCDLVGVRFITVAIWLWFEGVGCVFVCDWGLDVVLDMVFLFETELLKSRQLMYTIHCMQVVMSVMNTHVGCRDVT